MYRALSNELTSTIFAVPLEQHYPIAEGLISYGAQRNDFSSNLRNVLLNVK